MIVLKTRGDDEADAGENLLREWAREQCADAQVRIEPVGDSMLPRRRITIELNGCPVSFDINRNDLADLKATVALQRKYRQVIQETYREAKKNAEARGKQQ